MTNTRNNTMKDIFMDLVRCVNGFNFETIKVTADESATSFEAVTNDRTVIMKGKAKSAVSDLNGTFGLSNLSILQGILGLTAMKDGDASIEVKNNSTSGEPEELIFKGKGTRTVYRLMAGKAVPKQPGFMTPAFDVVAEPTKGAFIDFKEQAGVFAAVGTKFEPVSVDGELQFSLGDANAANHNSKFTFADVAGELAGTYKYPIGETLKALSLINFGECKVQFSSKGVMVIDVDTGIMELSFIFPGHS